MHDPFGVNTGPSATRLFLTIGLILVMLAAWGIIFSHIRDA